MCDALKKVGEICGMPTFFLSKKIGFHMQEVNWKIDHIFRYLLIFILGFGPLLILLKNSSFSQSKVNNITKKLPFIIFILIPIFFSLTMLVIAVDSGRWIHITFSCSIIIYLVMIRKGVVILNQNNSTIEFFNNKIHKLLKILIFFIICISWNPKAVHHEDLGSLPLYRVIEKTTNYYNNIWNIRVFQN